MTSGIRALAILLGLLAAAMTAARARADEDPSLTKHFASFARTPTVPYPDENAWSQAREDLGRTLFFDPRLSASGIMSCATCHNPSFSWGDGLARAVGHGMNTLERRTPTILNLAWAPALFWDGRAESLEEQALGPIQASDEMNLPIGEMVARLAAIPEYAALFGSAYPGEALSARTIAKALATFERGVVSGEAPFDDWIQGDESAISKAAKRGFLLFVDKAECASCHAGWRFTDDSFHDIGILGDDKGRGKLFDEIEVLQFAFKTPTLRNVDRRAPYMHDGSEATLEEVVALYNRGGDVKRPSLSDRIRPLRMTRAEEVDLVEFLKTLTTHERTFEVPAAPR
jgi:cytochrome c peroxidase